MAQFSVGVNSMHTMLAKLGIKPAPARKSAWAERKPEIQALAARLTTQQLATHLELNLKHTYRVLQQLGIAAYRPGPQPKASTKPASPKSAAAPVRAKPKPAPRTKVSAPSTRVHPPARPVQIVMPDTVRTISLPFNPPAGARVCNGTARGTYTSQTLRHAVGLGTAYGRFLMSASSSVEAKPQ